MPALADGQPWRAIFEGAPSMLEPGGASVPSFAVFGFFQTGKSRRSMILSATTMR